VDSRARIVWWCFPRFDSDPVFSRLVAGDEEKGFSDVVLDRQVSSRSEYDRNTAIVTTILTAADGAQVKITDFAPRLRNFERLLRPPQLMRMIEPLAGVPRVTIRVRPTQFYGNPMKRRGGGPPPVPPRGPAPVPPTPPPPPSPNPPENPPPPPRAPPLGFWPGEPLRGACPSPMSGRKPASAPPSR